MAINNQLLVQLLQRGVGQRAVNPGLGQIGQAKGMQAPQGPMAGGPMLGFNQAGRPLTLGGVAARRRSGEFSPEQALVAKRRVQRQPVLRGGKG